MADDNTYRSYRPHEPQRGGTQPSNSGGEAHDPLAELARLIGQGDPFGDFGRGNPRAPQQPRSQAKSQGPASAQSELPHQVPSHAPLAEPHVSPADTEFTRHDPYRMATAVEDATDPRRDIAQGYSSRESPFAPDEPIRSRQAPRMFAAATDAAPAQSPYFDDGAAMTPHDEDAYDDPPRVRRRGGLFTAVALIGCAMIGTAAAYGYRTYYVTPSASRIPPVITAEPMPNKVLPASESQSGKPMQDRVREPARNERLVSREEQPVDPWNQIGAPRTALPTPVQPARPGSPSPPNVLPPATTASASVQARGVNEPKPVRTIPIRPDGAEVGSRSAGTLPPSTESASAAARGAPAAKSAPPARNTGPLSLDPQGNPQAPSAPRDRVAAASPPATTQAVPQPPAQQPQQPPQPAGQRMAAAPPTGAGSFLVQLSSQRSETEAQTTYRALQAKYPDQLGGHSVVVKRVDLGAKGIYFRAMVGPFASAGDAEQFCTELKTAGGQCLIQRN